MVSVFSIWMQYCGCTVMLVFLIGYRLFSIKETETVLGSTHGNLTPPRISPSCSKKEQEYQRRCCHRKADRHSLLYGRMGPLPALTAAFMRMYRTDRSSRILQCRCPFSVFTGHTNGCISVSVFHFQGAEKNRLLSFSP